MDRVEEMLGDEAAPVVLCAMGACSRPGERLTCRGVSRLQLGKRGNPETLTVWGKHGFIRLLFCNWSHFPRFCWCPRFGLACPRHF